jgi:hypothetical protein
VSAPAERRAIGKGACGEYWDAEPTQTALRVFVHPARQANATRVCHCLQSGCNVDPIAVDAGALDDIANLDPHPECDPPISRYLVIALLAMPR